MAPVEPESLVLTLDGVIVAPDVTKAGVHHHAPLPAPRGVRSGFGTYGVPHVSGGRTDYAHAWSFSVAAYPTLPPSCG